MDLSADQLMQLVHARARRRFSRGLKRKPLALMKKLRKAKKEAPALEKPAVVKTHLRNMIVLPDMIGSIVGVHNGKVFNQVEIKVWNCKMNHIDNDGYLKKVLQLAKSPKFDYIRYMIIYRIYIYIYMADFLDKWIKNQIIYSPRHS